MLTKVGIVDYGICNLTSVFNAFEFIGCKVEIVDEPKKLKNFSHIVLPGVGSFPKGMKSLINKGLDIELKNEVKKGKPILGLCLGMQLFANEGSEFSKTKGLGLIEGKVNMIKVKNKNRLPHIGWNNVHFRKKAKIINGLPSTPTFYFVHSYSYENTKADYVVGVCSYSTEIVSIIEKDNIFGAQFHPEKSQEDGIMLLKNFVNI